MRVKIKQRPMYDFGPADCRCCSKLSWKHHKLDKQVLKETLAEVKETSYDEVVD